MPAFLRFGRCLLSLVKKNPIKVGIPLFIVPASPFIHFFLSWRKKKIAIKPIDDIIQLGSKPPIGMLSKSFIDRSDIIKEIRDGFGFQPNQKRINKQVQEAEQVDYMEEEKQFGIIIGPTGTGKTTLIRKLCNDPPTSGILYHEMGPGSYWGVKLAYEFNIPLKPDGLIGLGLSFLSEAYAHYYTLPDEGKGYLALEFVIELLAKRGAKYKEVYGNPPILFLDGADLLAKKDKDGFVDMINLAKQISQSLWIVFVSSEGHVMPLVHSTSSRSRAYLVWEILDLSNAQAEEYLMKRRMPENLAKQTVKMTGGRMIFLKQALAIFRLKKDKLGEKELFIDIKKTIEGKYVNYPMACLEFSHIRGLELAKYLFSKNGLIEYRDLSKDLFDNDKVALNKMIDELVDVNVLRYTKDGSSLTWHNRMIKEAAKEWIKNK